jgi:hypothetical protein
LLALKVLIFLAMTGKRA